MLREVLVIGGVVTMLGAQTPAPQPAAPATPPGTDIYELPFGGLVDGLGSAKPQAVATERGYENQPFFTLDGKAILFTANRDGKQTDIYEFDRAERRVRQLVSTPEAEYSATVTPEGTGFSVIRVEADGTQRLWRFDRAGSNPRIVLTDIKPVGYHAWIDAEKLALFVLGQPATLQLALVPTGKAEIVARDIGRSLQRIPGGRAVSFVQREAGAAPNPGGPPGARSGEFWVKQYDASSGLITPLVRTVAGSNDRDCAWLSDGTLLMSAGTKIFAWKRGEENWREVIDVGSLKLGAVTRMAVSPDGKSLAIVVNEPPQ